MTYRFGPGKLTAVSVATTAVALMGFSFSNSFLALCLWAVPYGLGAGGVDATLNNYVALHYASHHMSWLHCMWGLGASIGPYVMGFALTGGYGWNTGYRIIGILQIVLSAALFFSLPLWKNRKDEESAGGEKLQAKPVAISQVLQIPGAKEIMITFFCYCALEVTASLWAASYLNLHKGMTAEDAAYYASMFYIGITAGRAVCGFITMKLNDTQMIRMGQAIIMAGIAIMVMPFGSMGAIAGLIVIGGGCAPIYPCIIHSTPVHFGAERSQALIGVQMASAYIGTCIMPPVFGQIAQYISIALFPAYLFAILAVMAIMHEKLIKIHK